jgi:hypothetical protein
LTEPGKALGAAAVLPGDFRQSDATDAEAVQVKKRSTNPIEPDGFRSGRRNESSKCHFRHDLYHVLTTALIYRTAFR